MGKSFDPNFTILPRPLFFDENSRVGGFEFRVSSFGFWVGSGRDLSQQITAQDPTFPDPARILAIAPTRMTRAGATTRLDRLAELLTIAGGLLVLASYFGFWRVDTRWVTGLGALWQRTGMLVGSKLSQGWIPGYIWASLLCLVLLALFVGVQTLVPRLTGIMNVLKGLVTTLVLVLTLVTLRAYFDSTSTGFSLMGLGLVLLWLATAWIPLIFYLVNRFKQV